MTKFKVIINYPDGTSEEADEVCKTEAEAQEYVSYLSSCYNQGGEVLHFSNPGDYPPSEENVLDFDVIKVND